MMLRLQLSQALHLQSAARSSDLETCAAGLVFPAGTREGVPVFTVRQLHEVLPEAYGERTARTASLKPAFCTEIANAAKLAGAGVLLAHTHVGEHPLEGFSVMDDDGEVLLAEYFSRRLPGVPCFTAVFTGNTIRARALSGDEVDVTFVGSELLPQQKHRVVPGERYHRQVLAFGERGQAAVSSLKVAIVGLGGTGSVVASQLAHLGVRSMLLIDPDTVATTNLNRLVGATSGDVGAAKVNVAARHVKAISSNTEVVTLLGDVANDDVARALLDADFIFSCTDSMASRAVMNQLAYQFLIPCIDMGVGIHVVDGDVRFIAGRTQMLSPGLPCLVCTDKLDFEQVRREMMTDTQRKADPYIQGAVVPQPAVISLNSTVSSAAVTMFLAAVAGVPSAARMLSYDGKLGTMRAAGMPPRIGCVACSEVGGLGRGETWSLPTRKGS
jgi:molybdopterin/thiamine biosynthesis adenylyltransferase